MVELRAIHIPGMNGSFEATRTVLKVAGMTLMAIENGDADPTMVRQRFVPLQPVIDMMNPPPQALGIHESVHTPDGIGAA
jgi:hypothetical protein